ncbi:ABC transporter ATP-binding protein [Salinibacterium sp. ZJ454]|uniref:ABC transporter ATP-binding protein n=1 Tax=Salinibacterium sp. ZJ454 TaxID=2708339 RepID=UPI00141DF2E3|nr:ABC transporter ATP-binding protein [Salinibacterium sp. ZJ454]
MKLDVMSASDDLDKNGGGISAPPAVEIRNLTIHYGRDGDDPTREHVAVSDVSLTIPQGQILAIVGMSGCGKTSLINAVAGLIDEECEGHLRVFGTAPHEQRRAMSFMFARDALLPWRKARENVELALEGPGRSTGRRERRDRALRMLDDVGLAHAVNRLPHELSQGMRQRVALARTLVLEPKLILADEPFAALDAQTRLNVQATFLEAWEAAGTAVVLVTHDLQEALLLADRVVMMAGPPGHVVVDQPVPFPRPRAKILPDLLADASFRDMHHELFAVLRQHVNSV